MWLILQQDKPDDYVIATGQGRTVREFVEAAFRQVGLDWRQYVNVAPELYRPVEKVPFVGDATKLLSSPGWAPETDFTALIAEMVESDLISEQGIA